MESVYLGKHYDNIKQDGYLVLPHPWAAIMRAYNYPVNLHVIAVKETACAVSIIKLYNAISGDDTELNEIIADINFIDDARVVRDPTVKSLEYCGSVQLSKKRRLQIPKRALTLACLSDKDEIVMRGSINHMEILKRNLWQELDEERIKSDAGMSVLDRLKAYGLTEF